MTKKHFQMVADVIAGLPDFAPTLRAQKRSCAAAFVVAFSRDFPRFDADKFLAACKLVSDV